MPERDPVDALLRALYGMALSRGSGIAGIARAGGQSRVKINIRALFKYHDEETGYRLVEEAIAELGDEGSRRLEAMGIKLVKRGGTLYIEVPVDLLANPRGLLARGQGEA
ncbi:MAG: hypothetical protein F7C38_04620 [Desulfurococcales archaeon]|nr:hypothetical protein [Desulfurococcales archaeon]